MYNISQAGHVFDGKKKLGTSSLVDGVLRGTPRALSSAALRVAAKGRRIGWLGGLFFAQKHGSF